MMVEKLTQTERAVARLVAEGAQNREIARALALSPQTVKNHLTACYRACDLPAGRNQRVLLTRLVLEQGRAEEGR
jgi:DNA-binding NarL/FixJ family response regulator